jgi:hypothetical protein
VPRPASQTRSSWGHRRCGHPVWGLVRSWGLFLVLVGSAVGQARAQAPAAHLSFVVTDSVPLPPGLTTGIVWLAPDQLAVLSALPDSSVPSGVGQTTLFFQDRSGRLLRRVDFTGTLVRGLAWDGEAFWSCGDQSGGGSLLLRIDADTLNVQETFPTFGHHPCGVAWDGDSVWVVDRDSGYLDRFDPERGDVTRSQPAPGFSPYGLASDGTTFLVTDSATGLMYRLSGPRARWSGTVASDAFAYRGRDVVLTFFRGLLWFAPVNARYVYQVRFQ